MRNPLRRRAKLPGAESEWDETQHIPLASGEYVAIPEDQLPSESIERLAGITLYRTDEGSAVFVNIDAVEAELEDWVQRTSREAADALAGEDAPEPGGEEMEAATYAAFNNTDNWVKGGIDEMGHDDTRYSLFRVSLATGRIEPGERPIAFPVGEDEGADERQELAEDEVAECPECGRTFARVSDYEQHYRAKHG